MNELNKTGFNVSPMIYCLSDYYWTYVLPNEIDVSHPFAGDLTHFVFMHPGDSLSVGLYVRARSLACALDFIVFEYGEEYLNNLYGGEWLYMYENFLSQCDLYYKPLDEGVLRLMGYGFEYGRFFALGRMRYWETAGGDEK